jgi:WD40 repeat protein
LRRYRDRVNIGDTNFIELSANFAAQIRGIPKEDLLSQEIREQRRAKILAWSGAGALALLTIFAAWQWQTAEANRELAVKNERSAKQNEELAKENERRAKYSEELAKENEQRANERRDEALRTQSTFLSNLAQQQVLVEGDPETAALIAMEALPDATTGTQRPYLGVAEQSLYQALFARRLVAQTDKDFLDNPTLPPPALLTSLPTINEETTFTFFDKIARDRPRYAIRPLQVDQFTISADLGGKWETNKEGLAVRHKFVSPRGEYILEVITPDYATLRDSKSKRNLRNYENQQLLLPPLILDDAWLLAAADKSDLILFDVISGVTKFRLAGHHDQVRTVHVNKDRTLAVTLSDDKTVMVWNLKTGKPTITIKPIAPVKDAWFADGSNLVATETFEGKILFWDASSTAETRVVSRDFEPTAIDFSPNGEVIAVGAADRSVQIFDAKTGNKTSSFRGHDGRITHISFDKSGARIVTSSTDNTVRIWNISNVKEIKLVAEFKGETGFSTATFCGDDDRTILIAQWKGAVELISIGTKEVIRHFKRIGETNAMQYHERLEAAWCSLSGAHILTISDGLATLWHRQIEKPIMELTSADDADSEEIARRGDSSSTVAAFSPNGRYVAVSMGSEIRILDAVNGSMTQTLGGHKTTVSSLAFNNDGSRLYSGDRRGNGLLWDIKEKESEIVARLPKESDRIVGAAFARSSRMLATISIDGMLRLTHVFESTAALMSYYKESASACLSTTQRERFFLPKEVPDWCSRVGKWPHVHSVDKAVGP